MSEPSPDKSGQALTELNPGSAAVGSWLLKVVHCDIVEYGYEYQGVQVYKQKLRVMFVSPNAEAYCLGVLQEGKGGTPELQAAKLNMYKVNNLFRSRHISFTDDKKQYVNTPFKLVLDQVILFIAKCYCNAERCPTPWKHCGHRRSSASERRCSSV